MNEKTAGNKRMGRKVDSIKTVETLNVKLLRLSIPHAEKNKINIAS
jgi:hypothetical protein